MVVNKLLSLGFSENEAKSYISLLEEHPATAYEIAKRSSIPTSKIYEVISKLLEKEIIIEIKQNQKTKYIPKEPEEFVDNYKSKMDGLFSSLKDDLKNLKKENDISFIVNINDYHYFMQKAKELLETSKKSLLISTWKDELDILKEVLLKLNEEVKISIVHFGKTDFEFNHIFLHPIEDTIYSEKGGRGLVIIKDSSEVLVGTITNEKKVEGAFSSNKGFVTIAEDYIKHDIYIMKIVKRFDSLLIEKFGENYKELRDIFNDKSF
ncbi:MAG TPA: helix-turn-helix domain-containing protein [Spirochaetota bacterium]|nr:helix-turn-helix domain-containing protein [Spirochaetota bacterium]